MKAYLGRKLIKTFLQTFLIRRSINKYAFQKKTIRSYIAYISITTNFQATSRANKSFPPPPPLSLFRSCDIDAQLRIQAPCLVKLTCAQMPRKNPAFENPPFPSFFVFSADTLTQKRVTPKGWDGFSIFSP